MLRLPLFKVLSCSLLALSVASTSPSFGGKLTKQYEEAQTLEERAAIAVKGGDKIVARLSQEDAPERIKKLEARFKKWKERLEGIYKIIANPHEEQLAELSLMGKNAHQQLLHEILLNIFRHLSPKSLSRIASVCKAWNQASNNSGLWRNYLDRLDLKIPTHIEPKPIVITALNVKTVDLMIDGSAIEKRTANPIQEGIDFKDIDRLALLGYEKAITRKVEALANGSQSCKKDPKAAKNYIEQLVDQGNYRGIALKAEGLEYGWYGYEQDSEAAKSLKKTLAGKNLRSTAKGLEWTAEPNWGGHGEVSSFNEKLASEGNLKSITKRIDGLAYGWNGYKEDLEAAKNYIEELVAQGNPEGIKRRVEGLALGEYGYQEDTKFLTKYIELLAD